MNRKELAAIGVIATGVATILTALLNSLVGFGEHAPGIVVAVLIGTLVMMFYIAREQEIARERVACHECKREHASAMRELLQSVMADKQEMNDAVRAVETNLAELARGTRVSAMLTEISQKLARQEAAVVEGVSVDDVPGGRVNAPRRMNGKDDVANVRRRTQTTGGTEN